jgi:hypothetical protein
VDNVVAQLALYSMPIFLSLIGYFFHRLISQIDHISSQNLEIHKQLLVVPQITAALKQLRNEFDTMKEDVATALIASKQVDKFREELAVVRRNQDTIFKKLDEHAHQQSELSRVVLDFKRLQIK